MFRVILYALGFAALAIYSYHVWGNQQARAALEPACEALLEESRSVAADTSLELIIGPTLAGDLLSMNQETCAQLDRELALWRWNVGREVALPRDAERDARIAAALTEAHGRCPVVMSAALDQLAAQMGGQISPQERQAQLEATCGAFVSAAERWGGDQRDVALAWEWPFRLGGVL